MPSGWDGGGAPGGPPKARARRGRAPDAVPRSGAADQYYGLIRQQAGFQRLAALGDTRLDPWTQPGSEREAQ